jgi:hypothetical protein
VLIARRTGAVRRHAHSTCTALCADPEEAHAVADALSYSYLDALGAAGDTVRAPFLRLPRPRAGETDALRVVPPALASHLLVRGMQHALTLPVARCVQRLLKQPFFAALAAEHAASDVLDAVQDQLHPDVRPLLFYASRQRGLTCARPG